MTNLISKAFEGHNIRIVTDEQGEPPGSLLRMWLPLLAIQIPTKPFAVTARLQKPAPSKRRGRSDTYPQSQSAMCIV